ncbi:acyltransferase [Luteolibacter sp. SL250]|uniref:acyltransferase n=1 Tax=Luteolibacter sp. SL250 TaxID=2995170 RepID=UPI00226D83EB|nr:acyltransferase [Luteolibacter sp. SL250]WAC20184.1 acyltransferase [Luteolibacter sp. SL250]
MKRLVRSSISRLKALLSGSRIGPRCRIHPSAVLERRGGSITIGTKCEIHRGTQLLAYGGSIEIGDDCSINPGCILYGHGGLKIGSHVRIAAQTIIVPANHIFSDPGRLIRDQGEDRVGVSIGDDVWLGARVTVLDGVNIATGCVIGAGSVVTASTEPYGIYVGVPARLIKHRGRSGQGGTPG